MKKIIAAVCVVLSMSAIANAEADRAKIVGRLQSSVTVLQQIMMTPDKGVPQNILSGATCVAVVPGLKKAAFVVGGQYGQGVVTCRTGHGWSAPAFIQMAGGSFGFQIGGQSTDLVLIAVNDKGFQDLLKSKFKIGGDAAAAAGPVGRNSTASTDIMLNAELLSYSRSKGLFAGIDLNGTVVNQNQDDTRTFYGHDIPFETILKGNTVPPAEARPFIRTVAKYFVAAKNAQ